MNDDQVLVFGEEFTTGNEYTLPVEEIAPKSRTQDCYFFRNLKITSLKRLSLLNSLLLSVLRLILTLGLLFQTFQEKFVHLVVSGKKMEIH